MLTFSLINATLSAAVLSLPTVGEQIHYQVIEPTRTLHWTKEVTKVDPDHERLTLVTHEEHPNGWVDHKYSFWSFELLKKADAILQDCTGQGGEIEYLGALKSCKIITEDSDTRRVSFWWAHVPVTRIAKREILLKESQAVQVIIWQPEHLE